MDGGAMDELQSMGSLRVGHDWATSLSLFTFHALEKEMATHSSTLAWSIPRKVEAGGLPSMGSHRVRHDSSDLAAAAAAARYFLTSYFCIPVPYNEKDFFWGVSSTKSCRSRPTRTVQLQLLQCYWSGHILGLPWYWMVCLGNEQRSFCHFWDCIQVLTHNKEKIGSLRNSSLLCRKLRHEQLRGGLAESDLSWSLNSIPDTPRRAHRYATKYQRAETSQLYTSTLGTQWIQNNHGGFTK